MQGRLRLRDVCLYERRSVKNPLLTQKKKAARLSFAKS